MLTSTRIIVVASLASIFVLGCSSADPGAEGDSVASAVAQGNAFGHTCAAVAGESRCHAIAMLGPDGSPHTSTTPSGYGPADLQAAYKLNSSTGGVGMTVALIDAYDYPNAESDLAVYRAQYGLPPCTTANGCFKKVNQNGVAGSYPRGSSSWSTEEALDLDMVSAVCPNCKIVLVEANSAQQSDLDTAVNTAAALGANAISNSYGGNENSSSATDQAYNHPGVAITASSGDNGYGVEFPASSPYVIAVGGTHLAKDTSARGFTETVWTGAGSGCSSYVPKPSWQKDTGCAMRTVADVSAVADPNTGVAVYETYGHKGGWQVYGGTSVASPIVAAVFALNGVSSTFGASHLYANESSLFDVTSGSNGSCGGTYLCTGEVGYDGPTGLGTPDGSGAF